jgi:hypothetical protein
VRQDGEAWLVSYKPYQVITLKLHVIVQSPPALI